MKRLGTPIDPAKLQQAPQPAPPPVAAPSYPASPYAVPPQAPYAPPVLQPTMEQQIRQAVDSPPPPVPMPTPAPAPPPQPQPVPAVTATGPIPQYAQQPKSLLHAIDMGVAPVNVFVSIPGGEDVEAEITKVELKTSQNGNPMLALQLRATWPKAYVGALIYDNVVLTAEAAWKYKSLCSCCVDENGDRLLSDDNRFFVGNSEQDFLGNIVAFKSDEPSVSAAGNPVNKCKGGYNPASRTEIEEPSGNGVQSISQSAAIGVPPVPTF